MIRKKGFIFILIYFMLFLMISISTVSGGLGVSGATVDTTISPGQHFSQEIVVFTRETDEPMDIKVEVMGYGQSPSGGGIGITPDEDKSIYTARPLLNISPAKFHLDPGDKQKVTLEGDIPQDVGTGGRYALINIHSLPIGNGTIGVILAIIVPVRLTISGTEQIRTGIIRTLELKEPVSSIQQNVTLSYENTGNCHYPIKMDALLKDKEGIVLANASEPISYSPVIPTCTRIIDFSLRPVTKLMAGTYNIQATVSLEDRTPIARKNISFTI